MTSRWLVPLLLLLALPATLQAQWYQVTGSAPLVKGELEYARQQALEDALRQALLQAGANVSSLQGLKDGALSQDIFLIRSSGDIRQYQILQEEERNQRLYIKVRANIRSQLQACEGQQYAKGISLIRFSLVNPEQARYGHLFDINKAVTQALYQRLQNQRQTFVTQRWLDANLGLTPQFFAQGDVRITPQIQQLARDTESQYLLFGTLDDLSLRQTDDGLISQWFSHPLRAFALHLYLFDGLSGKLQQTLEYQSEAPWTFDKQAKLNVFEQTFWQSPYGAEIGQLLDRASQDLTLQLRCDKPAGRVVKVDGDEFHINLGSRNGIRLGERMLLQHKADYRDDSGMTRSDRRPAAGIMEVKRLYEDSAVLRTLNQYAPGNVQIGDLAVME
ncbi:flagellar assembly protein T N-terminal domain-containing protein [Pseudaeromonas paramecii]|uniref:Flagellar assembly protein FlgT n=1 Tax=Pseudaeromonas paramecii TaxID=2138166 RepID=A0ABP8Q476_9GAMM